MVRANAKQCSKKKKKVLKTREYLFVRLKNIVDKFAIIRIAARSSELLEISLVWSPLIFYQNGENVKY
jgi:hypothetical protein